MKTQAPRVRRTKAQIAQRKYNKEVDQYRWFIIDLDQNKVQVGYEFKDDAKDNLKEDYEGRNAKIVAKCSVRIYGIDIEEVLNSWKS